MQILRCKYRYVSYKTIGVLFSDPYHVKDSIRFQNIEK